jgi:redox-sensitive bicupin YhaK (pirin superfamily)
MITQRRSADRGHVREEWLETFHTISFDTYYDPQQMGFRQLRVINEDRVAPGMGFPLHPHRDMEILTVVVSGVLRHQDDHGGEAMIGAGEIQRITAGRGILHSEVNPSATEAVHLLQIWIVPDRTGLDPGYQTAAPGPIKGDDLVCLASPPGRGGAVGIHQDVEVYGGRLPAGGEREHRLAPGRHGWLQLIAGELRLNGNHLAAGDGAAVSGEPGLRLIAGEPAHYLWFDLA